MRPTDPTEAERALVLLCAEKLWRSSVTRVWKKDQHVTRGRGYGGERENQTKYYGVQF